MTEKQTVSPLLSGLRYGLALLRLALLFVLLCFLLLGLGLHNRQRWQVAPITQTGKHPPPALGVTVALQDQTGAQRADRLTRLKAAGFVWVRQRFAWDQLEPEAGVYVWTDADRMIQAITEAGLELVAVLDGSPAWARSPVDRQGQDQSLAPPANPASFARFATAFAHRYATQVDVYQIWDEPNIAPHWGNRHIDPIAYAQLVRSAAPAIRSQDPEGLLLLAALAPTADRGHTAMDEVYFLQRLYAAHGVAAVDGVAVQPFGFGYAPTDGYPDRQWLAFNRLFWVHQAMVAAGDGERDLWAVRFGWNRQLNQNWGRVTPAAQASYAGSALAMAARQPWIAAMGWALDRPNGPMDDPGWGFALIDPGGKSTSLLQALSAYPANSKPDYTGQPASRTAWAFWGVWGAWGGCILIVLWLSWRTAAPLPWSRWREVWRKWPRGLYSLLWITLFIVYYLAQWPPLIAACWVGAAWLIFIRPETGLWLALLSLPLHFQHKELALVNTTWNVPPAQALLLCSLPALVAATRREWRPLPGELSLLAGGWLLIHGVSAYHVWYWPAYWQGLVDLVVTPLALIWGVHLFVRTDAQRKGVLMAALAGALLLGSLGLAEWVRGVGTMADGVRRLVGPTFSPNHTALYLERGIFVGLGLLVIGSPKGWQRVMLPFSLAILSVALILTASRGSLLLGIPLGLALWFWGQKEVNRGIQKRVRNSLFWVGMGGLALVIALMLIGQTGLRERLANSATITERAEIWRHTLSLWQDHLFTGVGTGGFFWRFPAYVPTPTTLGTGLDPNIRHPHNLWLEFGANWGVAGLLWLMIAAMLLGRRLIHRSLTGLEWGVLAGLVAGFAHGQVDAFMVLPDLAGWNWLALALLLIKPQQDARSKG